MSDPMHLKTDNHGDPDRLLRQAKQIVIDYYNEELAESPHAGIFEHEVYVVWFAKALQNWKALVSTDVTDGRYYEVTYNGDRGVAYLDVYVKEHNCAVRIESTDD